VYIHRDITPFPCTALKNLNIFWVWENFGVGLKFTYVGDKLRGVVCYILFGS